MDNGSESDRKESAQKITFEHKFFSSVDGVYFHADEISGEPLMCLPIDGKKAQLPLPGIRNELKLEDGSHDAQMLDVVIQALNFVAAIKVGDPVPLELQSGEASWSVSEKHLQIARSRLSMQLVTWMSGDEEIVHDLTQLEMIAEDPAMRSKINDAFGEAAEKLGLGRDNKDEVIALINGLADELAYIEALRSEFEHISVVEQRIEELSQIYRSDQTVSETLLQVHKLCNIPMAQFRDKLDEIDAQTGEIIAVLKNMAAQVKFIREGRDDLFRRFWAWQGLSKKWHATKARRSRECEAMIQETYHFLAQRFLPQKEWELFSKAQEKAANANTESVWV